MRRPPASQAMLSTPRPDQVTLRDRCAAAVAQRVERALPQAPRHRAITTNRESPLPYAAIALVPAPALAPRPARSPGRFARATLFRAEVISDWVLDANPDDAAARGCSTSSAGASALTSRNRS
ncbi:hypothetical protein GCM10020218_097290 [Dactylosporangium vinaceum]